MSVQILPTEDTSPPAPRVVFVMVISGCGKSTVILLHSQFEALENENPVIVSIAPRPREIVAQILSALNMVARAQPPKQTSLRSSVLGAWTNP
jgi:hypothetical protein